MVNAVFYRGEAKRCRALAAAAHDAEAATRWLRIAKGYDDLADAIASEEASRAAGMHAPIQQQPVHQQQAKSKHDGGNRSY